MTSTAQTICPYCGEPIDLDIDETGGREQQFISDCEVCCRPIRVSVTVDEEGRATLIAEAESE